jgi:tol-pal system protein YbgF
MRRKPRKPAMVMAASAAMIVAASCGAAAWAQAPAPPPAPPSNSLVLVNQIQSLQAQMRQMQGEIEELQHALQQLQQSSKDQYVDLDSRIGKLEHAQPATAGSAAPATASSPNAAPAASTAVPPPPADEATVQADYQAAFKSLRDGNYVDSARRFRAFIDQYPQSPLVSNAYYWLGSSYQVTQNHKPALAAFQALLRQYPDSSKAPEAQLRVADCQIALKEYGAARRTLQAAIAANPGTQIEQRARDKLQDLPPPSGAQ